MSRLENSFSDSPRFSGIVFSVGAIESVGVTHIGCKISGADDLEKCI